MQEMPTIAIDDPSFCHAASRCKMAEWMEVLGLKTLGSMYYTGLSIPHGEAEGKWWKILPVVQHRNG